MNGVLGLVGVVGCVALMFVSPTPSLPSMVEQVLLGTTALVELSALGVGLSLAWRHRPDSVGFTEHPGASERR